MDPIIQLGNVSLGFLEAILKGITGACWIVIEVISPTRTEKAPNLRLSGNHESTADLETAVKAIAEGAKNSAFTFTLFHGPVPMGNSEDAAAFGLSKVIQAPTISTEKWQKMEREARQGLLIRTILKQSGWNQSKLCKTIGAVQSHLSNIANGKRGMGWSFSQKLIGNLPLSEEMIRMIREVADTC
jgi:hypothetical protein